MAATSWLGRAQTQVQITTSTLAGTWATGDTATFKINGKELTLTVGAVVTLTGIADAIIAMINGASLIGDETRNAVGSDFAEWDGITASKSGTDTIVLTADDGGVPYTVTVAEVTAGDGTVGAPSTTQAATGPNDVNNADNWSEGSVPGAGDAMYIDNTDVSLLYNLDQLSGTITSLTIGLNFGGEIGLPKTNTAGYPEYRAEYLAIDCTTIRIGVGSGGGGSGRIKIDTGSTQTTLEVLSTGGPAETGFGAVLWKGTHAANVVDVKGGSVSIAPYGSEVATVATLRVAGGAEVAIGTGCTITAAQNVNSTLTSDSSIGTLTQDAGGLTTLTGSAAITTYNFYGGNCAYNSNGTIGTLNIGGSLVTATIDASGDRRAKAITTINASENSQVIDPAQTITFGTIARAGRTGVLSFQ